MRGRIVIYGVVLLLLLATAAFADETYFKGKMTIPVALKSGSDIIEPGPYVITITRGQGLRWMTLQVPKGKIVARVQGQSLTPPKGTEIEGSKQLSFTRVPDENDPSKKWVVFDLDYKVGDSCCARMTFKMEEAAASEE